MWVNRLTHTLTHTRKWAERAKDERTDIPSAHLSLSKNYPSTPVSGIIEETGVFLWKAGEKMHGMSQSS